MGNIYYFLGTAFTWLQHADGEISVHLCQSEFTEFNAHRSSVYTANKVPNMTPYRSVFPIDSIPPVDPLDTDLPCQRKFYQNIFAASIGLQPALALTLPLPSHVLPRIVMLHILNITRPQFML